MTKNKNREDKTDNFFQKWQVEERTNQFQSIINLFISIIFWDSDILQKCVMDLGKNRHRDEVKFVKKNFKSFWRFLKFILKLFH